MKINKKPRGSRCGGTEELRRIGQIFKGDKRYKVIKKVRQTKI